MSISALSFWCSDLDPNEQLLDNPSHISNTIFLHMLNAVSLLPLMLLICTDQITAFQIVLTICLKPNSTE